MTPVKSLPHLLIGLRDDVVRESLRRLAGSVLGSLQRMIQVALGGGGYHRGNKRPDGSRRLGANKNSVKQKCAQTTNKHEFV